MYGPSYIGCTIPVKIITKHLCKASSEIFSTSCLDCPGIDSKWYTSLAFTWTSVSSNIQPWAYSIWYWYWPRKNLIDKLGEPEFKTRAEKCVKHINTVSRLHKSGNELRNDNNSWMMRVPSQNHKVLRQNWVQWILISQIINSRTDLKVNSGTKNIQFIIISKTLTRKFACHSHWESSKITA